MKNDSKNDKIYNDTDLVKAIYKTIQKKMKNRHYKDDAQEIIRDVLDPNYVAEVDPDEVPAGKTNITMKSDKGVDKLKKFQKSKKSKKKGRCWDGYEPTPGKKPCSEGSCRKKK